MSAFLMMYCKKSVTHFQLFNHPLNCFSLFVCFLERLFIVETDQHQDPAEFSPFCGLCLRSHKFREVL